MNQPIEFEDQEIAYAKLNLALHVRKRLPNGYHELETIFAFLDQGDQISVKSDKNLSLTISGPFADGLDTRDNLIIAAAQTLQKKYTIPDGAALHLKKSLPVASGIGGGSADAASTLRLLNRFWKLDLSQRELMELAKPLGADVPACILSVTAVGRGIGQDLQPLKKNDLTAKYVLLANPLVSVSTAAVFKKWDGVDRGPLEFQHVSEALITGRNDLQPIATALEKSISPLLLALVKTKPIASKMSGSGATCFGVYETAKKAETAKAEIEENFKKIWVMTGKLR